MRRQHRCEVSEVDGGSRDRTGKFRDRPHVASRLQKAGTWWASYLPHLLMAALALLMFCEPLIQEFTDVEELPPLQELVPPLNQGPSADNPATPHAKGRAARHRANAAGVPLQSPLTKTCRFLRIGCEMVSFSNDLPRTVAGDSSETALPPRAKLRMGNITQYFYLLCRASHRFLKQADATSLSVPRLCLAGNEEDDPAGPPLKDPATRFAEELLDPAERLADACEQGMDVRWSHVLELQELAEIASRWEVALRLADIERSGDADSIDSAQFSGTREPMTDMCRYALAGAATFRTHGRRGNRWILPNPSPSNSAAAEGTLDVAPQQQVCCCVRHACGHGVFCLAGEFPPSVV